MYRSVHCWFSLSAKECPVCLLFTLKPCDYHRWHTSTAWHTVTPYTSQLVTFSTDTTLIRIPTVRNLGLCYVLALKYWLTYSCPISFELTARYLRIYKDRLITERKKNYTLQNYKQYPVQQPKSQLFMYNTELARNTYINLYRHKFYIFLLQNFILFSTLKSVNPRWRYDVKLFIEQFECIKQRSDDH